MSPGKKSKVILQMQRGCILVSISQPMLQTPLDLSGNYCRPMLASRSREGICQRCCALTCASLIS